MFLVFHVKTGFTTEMKRSPHVMSTTNYTILKSFI